MSTRPEPAWFKSSYSGSQGGKGDSCAKVAITGQTV